MRSIKNRRAKIFGALKGLTHSHNFCRVALLSNLATATDAPIAMKLFLLSSLKKLRMKKMALSSKQQYQDVESPALVPSDESSGGGSLTESFHEEEQEPPRILPRRATFRSRKSTTKEEDSFDEMRKVLREVGAIDGTQQQRRGWSVRRSTKEERADHGWEPVWKRRLRTLKCSLAPPEELEKGSKNCAVVEDRHGGHHRSLSPRNGVVKSVSFDELSLTHPSASDEPTKTKKKKGQTSEETLRNKEGEKSSFTDLFKRVVSDEDMFSLDTRSTTFWSEGEETSIFSDDDNTTITSYQLRMPKMPTAPSCGVLPDREQLNGMGCTSSDSTIVDDLRLVAELLVRDVSCITFMTGEGIPPSSTSNESVRSNESVSGNVSVITS
jgi:hypothetical protein